MKNSIKKFVIACAAVTAVSAALSVSAMAATTALDPSAYDADNNAVTITAPTTTGEATVLVLAADKDLEDFNEDDILYINQAAGADFDEDKSTKEVLKLKGDTALADGTYLVAVGYDNGTEFTVDEYTLTLGGGTDIGETETVIVGDTDLDGKVNLMDATELEIYLADKNAYEGTVLTEYKVSDTEKYIVGDTDKDGKVNLMDATELEIYLADKNAYEGTVLSEVKGAKVAAAAE